MVYYIHQESQPIVEAQKYPEGNKVNEPKHEEMVGKGDWIKTWEHDGVEKSGSA